MKLNECVLILLAINVAGYECSRATFWTQIVNFTDTLAHEILRPSMEKDAKKAMATSKLKTTQAPLSEDNLDDTSKPSKFDDDIESTTSGDDTFDSNDEDSSYNKDNQEEANSDPLEATTSDDLDNFGSSNDNDEKKEDQFPDDDASKDGGSNDGSSDFDDMKKRRNLARNSRISRNRKSRTKREARVGSSLEDNLNSLSKELPVIQRRFFWPGSLEDPVPAESARQTYLMNNRPGVVRTQQVFRLFFNSFFNGLRDMFSGGTRGSSSSGP